MTETPEDRRPTLTPALALRVAIVGSVVLALFAILFFRLWFLQVLTGNQYVAAAASNQTRSVLIAPPRGEILDRNGKVLVSSTTARAVKIVTTQLPVAVNLTNILSPARADTVVYNRLARVLRMSTRRTHCTVPVPPPTCNTTTTHCPPSTTVRLSPIGCTVAKQLALYPYADVTVKPSVDANVQYYLAERQNQFPGVQVQQTSIPGYPQGDLAAQALGTVGQISSTQLQSKQFSGVNQNAVVGQSGLEYQYDPYLRGTFGRQQIEVDSAGIPTGQGRTIQPTPGHNLQTSLDTQLQRVGQSALQQSMTLKASPGGAFVALNPQSGAVYALGSLPSFNPTVFTKPISTAAYNRLTSTASGDPLFNRAIAATNPTGSTFKPITATAALQSGNWSLGQTFDDTGQFCVGTAGAQQCRHNAGHAVYGPVTVTSAIKFSSDDFFYNLGARTNVDPAQHPGGGPLDHWASLFGIGRNPRIDLPGAVSGTLPTPRWRAQRNKLESECDNATGVYRYTNSAGLASPTRKPGYHRSQRHPPGGCGIADGANRPWSIGDNESLAVGQGDVQVSPLQLAIVYSAVENGGTIVRPHIGESVQNPDGTVLQRIEPPPARHLEINPANLAAIQLGLRQAASLPGGTSVDVMGNFPEPVHGKTGTAQYIPTSGPNAGVETDYAWYACYVPSPTKPIVVVVWVEKGGFGDVAAAPVARQILSQWFFGKPGPFHSGSSKSY